MDLNKLKRISKALTVCLKITFIFAIIVTLTLSFILKSYFSMYFIDDNLYYYSCVVFVSISGFSSANILLNLIHIMSSINNSDPFVRKNAVCLKYIAYSSLIISVSFFALLFFRVTFFTFAISFVFLIAFFSCLVFSGLFQKAVEFKEENDLTI